jgi:hypothetical protein
MRALALSLFAALTLSGGIASAACGSSGSCDLQDDQSGVHVPAHTDFRFDWCSCTGDYSIVRAERDDPSYHWYECDDEGIGNTDGYDVWYVYKQNRNTTPVITGTEVHCCRYYSDCY